MMVKGRLWGTVLFALVCVFLLVNAGEARMVQGKTVSSMSKLSVSAVDTHGGSTTTPVHVTKKVATPEGTVFHGEFAMDVPEGKKVMIVFNKVKPGGGMAEAKTVAKFASGDADAPRKTQFKVTAAPDGGMAAIALGKILVGKGATVKPSSNPLDEVDTDHDGISDLDDADDDNDAIPDDEDLDDDADDVDDDLEDMDEDDDGKPDCVDMDDDADGIPDDEDLDDDNDGMMDMGGHMDNDDDGIEDKLDPDDDNDGIADGPDPDKDGDEIPDAKETLNR